jgi:hypothetical protein
LLLGTKSRTLVGPHEHLLGFDRVALPPLGHPVWISMELLDTREDLPQVPGHCVDLLGAHQSLNQDPTLFSPRRNFGVGRES